MRKLNFNFFTGVLTLCSLYVTAQQTYVNKDWEYIGGIPGQYDYVQSKLHSNGNLILVGNNSTNGQTDILITALSIDGTVAWQQTNSGANGQNDYGTDLAIDNTGNIFVCGAVHNGSNTDYRILKYSPDGTLIWTKQYNGTGNGDDVPVAIRIDASNNIYVTGTSTGSGTLTDFATLKYDQSGTLIWTKRYNYSNLPEIATCLEIDNSGNVFVAGASANNLNNSDFCVIKYNSSGTQMAVQRHSTTGNGYDLPSEMTLNGNGNVFIVGTSEAGNNKNVKLLALTNSLTVLWSQYIDQFGRDDEGYSITLTPTNNLVITGYSKKQSGGTNLIVAKYTLTGTQVWLKNKPALIDNEIAKGRKVRVNSNGKIFISGESYADNSRDLVTQSYDENGNVLWERIFDNNNTIEKASQLVVLNDEAYITGMTDDGSTNKFATIKYSTVDKPFSVVSSGDTSWNARELIIRFDTSAINKSAIDKIGLEYAPLSEFVKQSVIYEMTQKTGISWGKIYAFKIFTKLSTKDTISISRLGDTIQMPFFWASLSVFIPENINEQTVADSLETMYPTIQFAEKNYIGHIDILPNDPLFLQYQQIGLTSPTCGIGVEQSWNYEVGKENILIGVFDTGINYKHEDFGDGTYNGSKIKGGWDWINNCHVSSATTPDDNGHGTACAGIIGALRNNSKGLSGISGGDSENNNTGCALFSFKIANSAGNIQTTHAVEALQAGAASNQYGLHILSNSWGLPNSKSLREATQFAFNNKVVVVASSGNTYDSQLKYPASYLDDWTMKVGANDATGDRADFSTYGNRLDFIAPGTKDLYAAPNHNANNTYTYNQDGTSFSCPHVSGVSGLILSYVNNDTNAPNKLAPEDVEHILQNYTSDIQTSGYDQYTGWGRINVLNSFNHILLPQYKVRHFQTTVSCSSAQLYSSGQTVQFPEGVPGLATGYYLGTTDIYKLTVTHSFSIPQTETVIGAWARNSSSNLFDYTTVIYNPHMSDISLSNYSQTSVTLVGYLYKSKMYNIIGQYVGDMWFPTNLNSTRTLSYSIHTYDPTVGIESNEMTDFVFSIYPNPTYDLLNISVEILNPIDLEVSIYDSYGRLLINENKLNLTTGTNIFQINTSSLRSGVHIIQLKSNRSILIQKFTKI